jgi:hypothetical protein
LVAEGQEAETIAMIDETEKEAIIPSNRLIIKRSVVHTPGSVFGEDAYAELLDAYSDRLEVSSFPGVTLISPGLSERILGARPDVSTIKVQDECRDAIAELTKPKLTTQIKAARVFGKLENPDAKAYVGLTLVDEGAARVLGDIQALFRKFGLHKYAPLEYRPHISVMYGFDREAATEATAHLNELVAGKAYPIKFGQLDVSTAR